MQVEAIVKEQRLPTNTAHPHNSNGRPSFTQLLEQYTFPQPQRGDILHGEILRIETDALYVDVGAKRDAVVPYEEVEQLHETTLDSLSVGDEVPVYVTRTPIGNEPLIVSLERGLQEQDWERAALLQAKGETLELKIVNHNKGGLVLEFGRIQGFVPNSHSPDLKRMHDPDKRMQYKMSHIGTTLPVKIIEVDSQQDRLVLSATAAQREQRHQKLQALTEGDVVTGTVESLKPYGAFVHIGDGLTGLLHISRIAWEHIEHPADVLAIGDEVEVVLGDIDIKRERISLNRKVLLPGPWEQFAAAHKEGDLLTGEVTAVVDFGAFVRFPTGIEGLLHVNEIDLPYGSSLADMLEPGETVFVRILSIEPARQRLGLSMRHISSEVDDNEKANEATAPDLTEAL